ncbi:mediator of DNA damage checkpoint protein 1-like isoform X2 [Acanthaster planci]|uniref:Mediator of DNA damage checkpoint protein 1-like isoform X2 n=1 Tax=Acanthaster planci TaxID=133434 RepID=A0A8B7ZYB3_ACAPL|nr:mediator of DNA damage checkpoint protein 1-like isoform X2 [Acanthaster planci]
MTHLQCVCGCNKEQYVMLRQRVEESKQRITLMESEFLQSTLYTENELDECREELRLSQQRYNALEKSHQELHEINSDLEERILDIAAAYEKEKQALNREVLTLSQRLLDTKFEINKQEERNARYKKDCQLAVELLQCTPSGAYMQHKVSQLPHDLQYYVHQLMGEMGTGSQHTSGTLKSPTVTDNSQPLLGADKSRHNGLLASRVYDSVPANIIARAMQLRDEEDRKEVEKLVPTLRSSRSKQDVAVALHDKGTQTVAVETRDQLEQLCAKCGSELTLIPIEPEPLKPAIPEPEPKLLNLLDLSEPAPAKPAPKKANEHLLLDLLETDAPSDTAAELNLKRSLENLSLADLLLDISDPEPSIKPLGTTTIERELETPSTADVLSLISPLDSGSPMQDDMSDSSSASKESNTGTQSSVGSSLTEADAALATPKPPTSKPTGPARRVHPGPTHPQIQQNQKSNSSGHTILTESSQASSLVEPEFKKVGKAAVIKSQQRNQRSAVVNGTMRTPSEDTKIKDLPVAPNQKGSTYHTQNQAPLPESPSMGEKTERVSMYINENNAENLKKKAQPKSKHGGGTTKPTGQVIGSQHNRPANPRPNPNPTSNMNSSPSSDDNTNSNPAKPGSNPNAPKTPHFLQTSV